MASTKKVNILLSLKDRFSKPLAGTTKEIRKARQEMKLGQNQINKWGNSINNAFTGAVKKAAKFTAAMAAVGTGLGFKEAFSLETYKAQLETATGSTEKAAELMKNAIAMANKTPFKGGELVEATAMLEAMGMDSKKWLTYAGNMAGATGKDIMQATEAIIDAQSGEWERMKEFGIKGVKDMDTLVKVMDKRFAGGMDKLAKTTGGIWSTVTGVVKNSLGKIVGIMDDGSVRQGSALDKVKTKLSEFADTLTRWQNDGTVEKVAQKAAAAVDKLSNAFQWAKDNANWLIPVMSGLVGALVAFNVLTKVIATMESISDRSNGGKGSTNGVKHSNDNEPTRAVDSGDRAVDSCRCSTGDALGRSKSSGKSTGRKSCRRSRCNTKCRSRCYRLDHW